MSENNDTTKTFKDRMSLDDSKYPNIIKKYRIFKSKSF